MRMGLLHQMVVDCTRHVRLALVLQKACSRVPSEVCRGLSSARSAHSSTWRAHGARVNKGRVPFPPPDWMIKTSLPRTLSSISTRVSPPLNLARSTFAGGMPRWLQIVLAVLAFDMAWHRCNLLSELGVRAPAEDYDVAHHDDGGGVAIQSTLKETRGEDACSGCVRRRQLIIRGLVAFGRW